MVEQYSITNFYLLAPENFKAMPKIKNDKNIVLLCFKLNLIEICLFAGDKIYGKLVTFL